MTAIGTFYVDCGDGTLAGTGVSGNTITRNDTTDAPYTCTYTTGGVKTIKFAGLATRYIAISSSDADAVETAAIRFGYFNNMNPYDSTPALVAGIDGSLATMFPSLGTARNANPQFSGTFRGTKITSIPSGLFRGLTGGVHQFTRAFRECPNLTSIPGDLFSGITRCYDYQFYGTFWGCTNLTSIPENLFGDLNNCAAPSLFQYAFYNCKGITSIPGNLFRGIRGGATALFAQTFQECTNLQSIPDRLFSGVNTPARYLFHYTFYGCKNLSGYIPASAFVGLIDAGSPYNSENGGMFADAFYNTKLLTTTCPRRTELVETGYEQYWGGRIACAVPPPKIVTTSYVQGFYEEIDTKKQDKLESGVNLITTGAPDGMVVSITADHGVVHVHKEEIQIPVGSVENPTGWLPIWVE